MMGDNVKIHQQYESIAPFEKKNNKQTNKYTGIHRRLVHGIKQEIQLMTKDACACVYSCICVRICEYWYRCTEATHIRTLSNMLQIFLNQ